jgi:6-pyruvoyltetrahydropterin/6-carboxytetrahydropterin synthase
MIVTLIRRAGFAAAHNYSIADLSDSDNLASFGRYASDQPHGHNFVVEVAITGKVDETTGMVINMTEVDRLVRSRVIGELDGKYLNREVAFFAGRSPTTENLVEFVRAELESALTEEAVLTAVTVRESERLWSRWESDRPSAPRLDKSMMALTRAYDFSASHRLHAAGLSDERNRELFGKCNNPNGHGHNYEIEITIAGKPDERSGMLFSLDELDEAVRLEVLDIMDHKNLNLDVADFANVNPTSEMLAVVIWRRLARRLPTTGDPRLAKVVVRETARNSFEYCGD